jgi:hypothetical protein
VATSLAQKQSAMLLLSPPPAPLAPLQVYGLPFDLTRKYDAAFGYKVRAAMARFKKAEQ